MIPSSAQTGLYIIEESSELEMTDKYRLLPTYMLPELDDQRLCFNVESGKSSKLNQTSFKTLIFREARDG